MDIPIRDGRWQCSDREEIDEKEAGREGYEMRMRWGRDGDEMGTRWERDGNEMGTRWVERLAEIRRDREGGCVHCKIAGMVG